MNPETRFVSSRVNIVLAYAEMEDARQGGRFCQAIMQRLRGQYRFSMRFWKFAALNAPELRAQAVARLASAQILVFASGTDFPVNREVAAWLENGLASRPHGPLVIAALLADCHPAENSTRSFLEQIARSPAAELHTLVYPAGNRPARPAVAGDVPAGLSTFATAFGRVRLSGPPLSTYV